MILITNWHVKYVNFFYTDTSLPHLQVSKYLIIQEIL